MATDDWPILLIEVVLVFGGTLAFGWWQLRSIKRDQEETRRKRELERAQENTTAPPPD